jgi:hypothetical protein
MHMQSLTNFAHANCLVLATLAALAATACSETLDKTYLDEATPHEDEAQWPEGATDKPIGTVTQALADLSCTGYTSGGGQRVIGKVSVNCSPMIDVNNTYGFGVTVLTRTTIDVQAMNEKQNIGWHRKPTSQLRMAGWVDVSAPAWSGVYPVDQSSNGDSWLGQEVWGTPWFPQPCYPPVSFIPDLVFFGRDGTRCTIVGDDVADGSGAWVGATSMTMAGDELFIIQNDHLYAVDRNDGSWSDRGGGWSGPTLMTTIGDSLYVVDNGFLFQVDHSSGASQILGPQAWFGATSMTAAGDELFIIQNDHLYAVDRSTGAWSDRGAGWDGPTLMTTIGTTLYAVQNDYLLTIDKDTGVWRLLGNGPDWPASTSMTAIGEELFIVQGGTLFKVDRWSGAWSALGPSGIWFGPTLLTHVGDRLYGVQGNHLFQVDKDSGARVPLGF